MNIRQEIHKIISPEMDYYDKYTRIYEIIMIVAILISIIPLGFKNYHPSIEIIDHITVTFFIIDYVIRIITADYEIKKEKKSFVIYPFTPIAIIDLLSIMPYFTVFNSRMKLFKLFRLVRTLNLFKFIRFSKTIPLFKRIFQRERDNLYIVSIITFSHILISAIIMFNAEPESFTNFFDAIYWSTISLTTVGYGDITPISALGKIVSMVTSLFGIIVIALPTGIIAAAFVKELNGDED